MCVCEIGIQIGVHFALGIYALLGSGCLCLCVCVCVCVDFCNVISPPPQTLRTGLVWALFFAQHICRYVIDVSTGRAMCVFSVVIITPPHRSLYIFGQPHFVTGFEIITAAESCVVGMCRIIMLEYAACVHIQ